MALTLGARLDEMAQIKIADVRKSPGGHWYIDMMNLDVDQHLKNEQSRRHTPVHPLLIRIGFLDFVVAMRGRGEKQLFPTFKPNRSGVWADKFSKSFGRELDRKVTKDSRYVFHSFRHTWEDACRDSGIPKDVRIRLNGHASADISDDYGVGHSLKTRAKWMARLRVPVDLSHLIADRKS